VRNTHWGVTRGSDATLGQGLEHLISLWFHLTPVKNFSTLKLAHLLILLVSAHRLPSTPPPKAVLPHVVRLSSVQEAWAAACCLYHSHVRQVIPLLHRQRSIASNLKKDLTPISQSLYSSLHPKRCVSHRPWSLSHGLGPLPLCSRPSFSCAALPLTPHHKRQVQWVSIH